jgi:hypothetical protein
MSTQFDDVLNRLVIMILVDVANGKQRHVPYRDSKLTFLLQVVKFFVVGKRLRGWMALLARLSGKFFFRNYFQFVEICFGKLMSSSCRILWEVTRKLPS